MNKQTNKQTNKQSNERSNAWTKKLANDRENYWIQFQGLSKELRGYLMNSGASHKKNVYDKLISDQENGDKDLESAMA